MSRRLPSLVMLRPKFAFVGFAVRTTQVRVIQEVEDLRAELNLAGPLQREVLEERDVPLHVARVAYQISRLVAERPRLRRSANAVGLKMKFWSVATPFTTPPENLPLELA